MLWEVQLILKNKFGEYKGRKVQINSENYEQLIKMSKTFYTGGFELTLEDGSFSVFAPNVVQESVLTITKKLITGSEVTEEEKDDV